MEFIKQVICIKHSARFFISFVLLNTFKDPLSIMIICYSLLHEETEYINQEFYLVAYD